MTFTEASAVAKANPGSVLRRLPDGQFGVVLSDGSWVGNNGMPPNLSSDGSLRHQVEVSANATDDRQLQKEVESKIRDRTRDLLQQRGEVIAENDRLTALLHKASNTISKLSDENLLLKSSLKEKQTQVDSVVRPLERKIASMDAAIADKEKEIIELINKSKRLKDRMDLVSSEEWARIDQILETEAQMKSLQRKVIHCTCNGEVENCYRCDGKGEYVVDGNGNRCA
ncbi:TPA: hypothetical protein SIA28_003097 [Aeromonas salmonicida]|uniref:hypothetical protein n=1 Tax=Aeromonas salmonicida TaxID=645 RepID=UPI00223ED629|nr:hypothetical protein [Aeromonas salmonicida]MDF8330735.1 hypothetical protein [Aeromonas salmonicida]MDF8331422.1 hypothetical protein [Aeromonas salmonicida]HEH9414456.1 hypothetical protein [Aeromonas salmonicida]HEH9423346.1 hypothetical protein [Aeromonas salmonicida]HEH9436541.1 hypothetical protein [Aeromonas salmonicida]